MVVKSAGDRGHRYGKCGGHVPRVPRVRYAHGPNDRDNTTTCPTKQYEELSLGSRNIMYSFMPILYLWTGRLIFHVHIYAAYLYTGIYYSGIHAGKVNKVDEFGELEGDIGTMRGRN